jgi:hypothetical protein
MGSRSKFGSIYHKLTANCRFGFILQKFTVEMLHQQFLSFYKIREVMLVCTVWSNNGPCPNADRSSHQFNTVTLGFAFIFRYPGRIGL